MRSIDDARRYRSRVVHLFWPVDRLSRHNGEGTVKTLLTRLRALTRDDSGQDLLEYALLVALIAIVAYGAVQTSGQQVNSLYASIATMMQNAAQAAGA
jgi:Flp pilus assembly pilin Flp